MKIFFTLFCVFLFPLSVIGSSTSEIEQLKNKVHELKIEAERAQDEYLNAKLELERMQKPRETSRKISDKMSATPNSAVFNKKHIWNPEKILWNNNYFECGNYLDDGSCEYVVEMKDVKIAP